MRGTELLRLVWLNINQNRFKTIMTSIGIVVGAATIVMVFGIGRGGQMDVAEQFAELNAGAIDVSYEYAGEDTDSGSGGFSLDGIGDMFGSIGNMFSGFFGGGGGSDSAGGSSDSASSGSGGMNFSANMPGGSMPGGTGGSDSGTDTFSDFSGGTMPGGTDFGSSGDSASNFPGGGDADSSFPGGDFSGGPDSSQDGSDSDAAEGSGGGDAAADQDGEESGTEEESGLAADADAAAEDQEDSTEAETSMVDDRLNQEKITLSQSDVEDIERYVTGISGATISYSTKASVEGANLTSAQTYTVAGVKESYASVSRLELAEGDFLTDSDDDTKSRVCVLGSTVAKELFGSSSDITGSTIYIDDRTYEVLGVLEQSSTVSAGISPDTAIFIPYETGIKYITGSDIDPVITVIAEDVNVLSQVIEDVRTVLQENYSTADFTFEDSGSKMEAAQASNKTLTMLLSAMAVIVFLVGGIGIMNVLFVSVKERTNEIGILKAIGTSRGSILTEFLIESAAISCIGGILGVVISFGILPVVERFDVRVEISVSACLAALGFAVLTGTVFGIYPAWKASRLEPVEALNAE